MARKREKSIRLRGTDKEVAFIEQMATSLKISRNEYLITCAMQKEIVIVPGFDEGFKNVTKELKYWGNNLNQITKKAHQGTIPHKEEIIELTEVMRNVWQSLNQLSQENRERHY